MATTRQRSRGNMSAVCRIGLLEDHILHLDDQLRRRAERGVYQKGDRNRVQADCTGTPAIDA